MSCHAPAGVKLVLEAVCVLKGVKPVRLKDTNTGQMVDNYWEASKKMVGRVRLLACSVPLAAWTERLFFSGPNPSPPKAAG